MIITNVQLVLENEVVLGSLEIQNGVISQVSESPSQCPEALDGEGAFLLPGLVELHTDNLDKFFTPRPSVNWPAHSAMSSHDALIVASGITTVHNAIAVGDVRDGGHRRDNLEKMIAAMCNSHDNGLNRAEHRLHLRCELTHELTVPLFEALMKTPRLSLVSLMDHSPGQRQYTSLQKYREYFQNKYHFTDRQMADFEEQQTHMANLWSQPNRAAIAALCRDHGITIASHDDATDAHVEESYQLGGTIAEFPTTEIAAARSRERGMQVLMGAPNVVRGGSHSGNVSALHLAQQGLLDILSSDYYPASLLDAAFRIAQDDTNGYRLPAAIALVTRNPAQAVGLFDRGILAEGARADLVLASHVEGHIHVRHVWSQGRKVY